MILFAKSQHSVGVNLRSHYVMVVYHAKILSIVSETNNFNDGIITRLLGM